MEMILAVAAGFGLGWIVQWWLVSRKLVETLRDMRYAGFVHDAPPSRKTPVPPEPLLSNET